MSRTHYTVTFPAASPGDDVTWPNTVQIFAEKDAQVPLQSGQTLNDSHSFSGWSDATSIVFTRPAGTNDTVTVTSGSPTGTGAAAPAPSGGSSQVVWTAVQTADYAASAGDAVPADASGGAVNVTLPAPTANAKVTVKNVGASGTVTVLPHDAETIDGASSYPIAAQWLSRDFQADGTDWLVV